MEELMETGMLWYDNDRQSNLIKRIHNATVYYSLKYGAKPDICFVHPSMFTEENVGIVGMEIRKNHLISPNYFWLGTRKPI